MKKTICILASAALLAGCEQRTEVTPAAGAASPATEHNTTIVNPSPAGAKTENNTTIVNPTPADGGSSSSSSSTSTTSSPASDTTSTATTTSSPGTR